MGANGHAKHDLACFDQSRSLDNPQGTFRAEA
jgi:hypothetical protein